MIAFLQGVLHTLASDHIILLTQGVGYQVYLSKRSLEKIGNTGDELELFIHSVIREDSHQLFGFPNASDKEIFLRLIQVNSIGPKLALSLLSALPAGELAQAICKEDLVQLTAIPGIGKKTAERLVVDLKDKMLELASTQPMSSKHFSPGASLGSSEEALSALMNLGYSRAEAQKALQQVPHGEEMSLEALVREGLKALS